MWYYSAGAAYHDNQWDYIVAAYNIEARKPNSGLPLVATFGISDMNWDLYLNCTIVNFRNEDYGKMLSKKK